MGPVVKSVNGIAQYGLATFLPLYLISYGYSKTEWLHMWSAVFWWLFLPICSLGSLVTNLAGGKPLCGSGDLVVMPLFSFWCGRSPVLGHNFYVMAFVLCLCGVTMAGYVPLSALFPMLAPDSKGAAMSVLNLGAGTGLHRSRYYSIVLFISWRRWCSRHLCRFIYPQWRAYTFPQNAGGA